MRDAPVLHLFGGKGGAGKTTLASAFALTLSDANPKEHILLCTSEVTRGLSDVWRKRFTGKPTRLVQGKGEAGLSALEFEVATVDSKVQAVRAALAAAAPKGLLLGDEDLGKLVSGVVPGLEPLFGLLAVVSQIEPEKFDRVVVDMAGTGPTLRLFDTATLLRRAIALVRGEKPAAKKKDVPVGDTPLDQLVAELDRFWTLVKDPQRTAFHLVAQAEPVGEAQAKALFAGLRCRLRTSGSSRPSTSSSRSTWLPVASSLPTAWRVCAPSPRRSPAAGRPRDWSSALPRGRRHWCGRPPCLPSLRRPCHRPG